MNEKALENLVQIHKLHHEPADASEVQGLIQSGTVRLKDAGLGALSLESRFDLSYNAAKWRVLDQAHRKRNLAEYEGEIDLDEALVTSLVEITEGIRRVVVALTAGKTF